MPVRMELSRILIREMTDQQIIELTEIDGERRFPIVIGLAEAVAIERRLKGIEIPRPQTHDLLAATIKALGGTLRKIVIHDLNDATFYAKLVIEQQGRMIEVDSRPSDAIALGVADNVEIEVAESVLSQTQTDAGDDADDPDVDDDDLEFT
ncbi:MAG: bifunctional nuclease family protein [Phycisphaeraceae bacterium]|nr:bifunctional nuclease family protein [Phycisphaerales bacterium]QOJ16648.1 MAG: bifunctional nuclease family protein [Phycisphaeraceae bacterium]